MAPVCQFKPETEAFTSVSEGPMHVAISSSARILLASRAPVHVHVALPPPACRGRHTFQGWNRAVFYPPTHGNDRGDQEASRLTVRSFRMEASLAQSGMSLACSKARWIAALYGICRLSLLLTDPNYINGLPVGKTARAVASQERGSTSATSHSLFQDKQDEQIHRGLGLSA